MEDDGGSRLMAACEQCGSVYAAMRSDDGRIIPIGSREGCRCGGTSFEHVVRTDSIDASDGDEEAADD